MAADLNLISGFSTISLAEMDRVKLLDRTDTKFVFSEAQLPMILEALKNDYFILEEAGSRTTKYETLYFDTGNFDFYYHHHNGKLNRFKARYRRYVESNKVFFEVKFKSNKGRTMKDRLRNEQIPLNVEGKNKDLYEAITGWNAEDLVPQLWVLYKRITLVSKTLDERVTLDIGLTFRDGMNTENKKTGSLDNVVIGEVKQNKMSSTSPFIRLMSKHHLRELSISKYCIGISKLYPHFRKNNFKEKLLTINKIVHGLH